MQVALTIKNYRCFPDSRPLRFEIRDGFVAFVGVNNSGKSSILKFFYEFRNLFSVLTNHNALLSLLRGGSVGFSFAESVKDPRELFCDSNDRDLNIDFSFTSPSASSFAQPLQVSLTVRRDSSQTSLTSVTTSGNQYKPDGRSANVNPSLYLIQVFDPATTIDFREFVETLKCLASALYIGAFRNAINAGSNENYFDISVGQSFIKLWRVYKSGDVKKHNELIWRVTRDISAIFDLDLEINPSPDDQTMQINVGGRSFKLNELGAGIAQFILVLGTVAIKRPSFVLIDEPELNLHPSLQLSFLTTLASYAQNGIVFSTHSIGLARAMADCVYAVKRIQQGESEVTPLETVPRYAEFLGELSFNGYQELGFDKILLVEGPTEVRTIQQFLRQLKKDHKIVLLQLGGSSMINGIREQELLELSRISKNISALIDSEQPSAGTPLEPSRSAFVEVCKNAGIFCHVLERRATENYLSDNAIKSIKGPSRGALGPYEKLVSAVHWNKSENWLIARQMQLSDLAGTDLFRFLAGL